MELGVVTGMMELEEGQTGDEVPGTETAEVRSAAKTSPWADAPRSMNRVLSFLSRI